MCVCMCAGVCLKRGHVLSVYPGTVFLLCGFWAVLLQRGLRFNKTSKELWLAYYDVELKCLSV